MLSQVPVLVQYGDRIYSFFESIQLTFSLKISHNKFAKSATVSAQ